jgi:hypothetical protein
VPPLGESDRGAWCWINRLAPFEDLLAYAPVDQDLMASRFDRLRHALRLDDAEQVRAQTSYLARWRQFQALLNLLQFSESLVVFTTSEAAAGTAPILELGFADALPTAWQAVIDETVSSLEPFAKALAASGRVVPVVEYYDDAIGDELFAELAWPDLTAPLAVLSGDQASFAGKWQAAGWSVCTDADLKAKGWQWVMDLLPPANGEGTHA